MGKLGRGPRSQESTSGMADLGQPMTQGRPTPDPQSPLCSPQRQGSAARPPGRGKMPGWLAPPCSSCSVCSQHRGGQAPVLALALLGLVPFLQVSRAPGPRAHGASAQGLAPGLRPLLGYPLGLQGLKQVTPAVAPTQGAQGAPELALDVAGMRDTGCAISASCDLVLEGDTETGSPRG